MGGGKGGGDWEDFYKFLEEAAANRPPKPPDNVIRMPIKLCKRCKWPDVCKARSTCRIKAAEHGIF